MPNSRRVVITGFGAVLLGILCFFAFFYLNFRSVEVRGQSMEPTFESGRRLLMSNAYWLVGPIRKNDIVVIKVPDSGETLIKRVKGVPGDVIDFMDVPHSWRLAAGEFKVPPGTLYCLGDNRPVSQDSRDYGPFENNAILGKVVIFGTEPWLYGITGLAVLALLGSGLAAIYDTRRSARKPEEEAA